MACIRATLRTWTHGISGVTGVDFSEVTILSSGMASLRIVIFGNSGSGKSTLARALANRAGLAHLDLDDIAWKSEAVRQDLQVSLEALEFFQNQHPAWVIEGCYGSLIRAAAARASQLIFLNPGVEACQQNCRNRAWEPHKYPTREAQDANLAMLLDWVAGYETRDDEFSLAAHRSIVEEFAGNKTEVTSNSQAVELIQQLCTSS